MQYRQPKLMPKLHVYTETKLSSQNLYQENISGQIEQV